MLTDVKRKTRIQMFWICVCYAAGLFFLFFQMARLRSFPQVWQGLIPAIFFLSAVLFVFSLVFLFFLNKIGRLSLLASANIFVLCAGLFQFAHTFEKVIMTGYWRVNKNFFIMDVLACVWILFVLCVSLYASFTGSHNRKMINVIMAVLAVGFMTSVLEFAVSSSFKNPLYYMLYSVSLITSPSLVFPLVPIYMFTRSSIKERFGGGHPKKTKYHPKTLWVFREQSN